MLASCFITALDLVINLRIEVITSKLSFVRHRVYRSDSVLLCDALRAGALGVPTTITFLSLQVLSNTYILFVCAHFFCSSDNLMNLELLFWAGTHGGNTSYVTMATEHASRAIVDNVNSRGNNATIHVIDYGKCFFLLLSCSSSVSFP
jgi:hypothetical protein